jgi:spermidine/putrescine transport system permease protein
LWILLLLLYSPIVIIVIYSFTEAKVLGNWTGFSTKLYSSLFTTGAHHSLMNALINTITIALLAATASTLLGSIAAIGIFNLKARSRKAIGFVNSIPILNGDIITGISLFLLFVSLGITQGYTTVVLAHITFCTPYVVLSVLPRLKQMNPNIYEAALDLGATPMQALWKVIIPEIRPGMISGFMLALHRSSSQVEGSFINIRIHMLQTGQYTQNNVRGTKSNMSKHYGCVALCDPQRYKQKEQGYTGDNITIQNRNAVHKSDRFA